MHEHLSNLIKADPDIEEVSRANEYLSDTPTLKSKMESQDQYLETMKGYELDVQRMKYEFIDLKIKNAQAIFKLKSQPSITSQVAALQKTMSDIDGHF